MGGSSARFSVTPSFSATVPMSLENVALDAFSAARTIFSSSALRRAASAARSRSTAAARASHSGDVSHARAAGGGVLRATAARWMNASHEVSIPAVSKSSGSVTSCA